MPCSDRNVRSRALLVVAAALAVLLPNAARAQRAVFVVRHAEKEREGSEKDIPLSKAGALRAERLAALLSNAGVTAIYSTDTVRARDTAGPLARALKLTIKTYDVRDVKGNMTAEPLVTRLRANEKDGVALVVGHSNTVPDVLAAYGVREQIHIGPDDYGDLFLVVPQLPGQPVVIRMKF